MSKKQINISIDRDLWDALSRFAHAESIKQGKRFSTIKMLRIAARVLLRLKPCEINEVLKRNPHYTG